MEVLTAVSVETVAVIVGALAGGVVAPFAAALGRKIYNSSKK